MLRRLAVLPAALLCAAAAVNVNVPTAAAETGCTPATEWPASRPDLADEVVDLVNAYRRQLSLPTLAVSPPLTAAATWKARNMAAFDYMDHADPAPTSRTAGARLAACGYPEVGWGENIAKGYGTARDVFNAWLASPPHRANIEDPAFRATGVGMAGASGYWSQTFGTAVDGSTARAATTPRDENPPPIAVSAADSSVAPVVRVHCRRPGRAVSCEVRGGKGTTLRIKVVRGGALYASVKTRVASDAAQLRLRALRKLRVGRYALLVRVALPSGTQERRLTFSVR